MKFFLICQHPKWWSVKYVTPLFVVNIIYLAQIQYFSTSVNYIDRVEYFVQVNLFVQMNICISTEWNLLREICIITINIYKFVNLYTVT